MDFLQCPTKSLMFGHFLHTGMSGEKMFDTYMPNLIACINIIGTKIEFLIFNLPLPIVRIGETSYNDQILECKAEYVV